MKVTPKVQELRETYGFLPDEDLYEFAALLMENICAEMKKQNAPMSDTQRNILLQYFK